MTKRRPLSDLPKLFWGTLTVSALTFGGGFVIVPLLSERFSKRYGWINEEEMLDIVAIAQATPGVIAVNSSLLIGLRTFGVIGALVALVATILPPLVFLTALSLAYDRVMGSKLVAAIFRGLMLGVSVVILNAVCSMQATLFKPRKAVPIVVMAVAFGLNFVAHVSAVYIIVGALALGLAMAIYTAVTGQGQSRC